MTTPRPADSFVIVFALVAALAGCARPQGDPRLIEDARIALRVKTALVNDPGIGTRAIEVSVHRGVAQLSGVVSSQAEVDRAIALARAVAGVVDVEADLRVQPIGRLRAAGAPAAAVPDDLDGLDSARDRGLLAVGFAFTPRLAADEGLDARWTAGPLIRLGSGSGLGVAVAFGWFKADFAEGVSGAPVLGELTVRPVMGGLGYTVRRGRGSIGLSLVGGVAFNSFALKSAPAGQPLPISAGNSFAWRPAVSFWYDPTRRLALNVSLGYVVTRPRLTLVDEGRLESRRLRSDTAALGVGLAYKVF